MIESTLQLQVPGMKSSVAVSGAVSRIVGFSGVGRDKGHIKGTVPNPEVKIQFLEWESKEGSEYLYEAKREPYEGSPEDFSGPGQLEFEVQRRYKDRPDYDPKNPLHVAQANALLEAAPGFSLEDLLASDWRPTEEEEYKVWFRTWEEWAGKYAEEPLRERTIQLPLELALMVISQSVPGENPQGSFDTITSNLYRAAMLSGQFVDPKVA